MLFERKKIQTEILGEYLKSARENLGLSVDEVSKKTGIKLIFLAALENSQFKILPADVYVYGFLRQLAGLYSAAALELINQYKKEKGIALQMTKPRPSGPLSWYKGFWGSLVITPKVLTLIAGLAFIILTVAYIIWQVLSINKTPFLKIISPANNSVILGSSLDVSGQTDPSTLVTVNAENVFVNAKGEFDTVVGLTPGRKPLL